MAQSKVSLKVLMIVAAVVITKVVEIGAGCLAGQFEVVYPTRNRCLDCNSCPPGYSFIYDCDFGDSILFENLTQLRCIPCSNGTFKVLKSYQECKKCTKCPPGTTSVSACNKTANTVCGCDKGQRMDSDGNCISNGKIPSPLPPTEQTTEMIHSPSIHTPTLNHHNTTKSNKTRISPSPTGSAMNIGTVFAIVGSIIFAIFFIVAAVGLVYRRKGMQGNYSNRNASQVADAAGSSNGHIYVELEELSEAERTKRAKATESVKSLPPNYSGKKMRTIYGETPFTTEKRMLDIISTHLTIEDLKKIWDGLRHHRKRRDNSPAPNTVKHMFDVCRTLVPKWTLSKFFYLLIEIGRADVVESVCRLLLTQHVVTQV